MICRHEEARPSRKDLPYLWQALHLAQKMGAGMGRSPILQRPLPGIKTETRNCYNMNKILIAGAGKGIGLRTAELLNGTCHLYTMSRNLTPDLDLLGTDFRQFDTAADDLSGLTGLPEVLHGLVYCPGSINLKPFSRFTADEMISDFRQNVVGAVGLIQKVLPSMKKANGASIVLFSTVAVKNGLPFHASVAASKGAVEGLARSLAAELASSGIRVNVIAPSLTDTPLAGSLLSSPEKREAAAKRHPIPRVGTADDMASIVRFLLSEESSWITGQVIGVDGGMSTLRV